MLLLVENRRWCRVPIGIGKVVLGSCVLRPLVAAVEEPLFHFAYGRTDVVNSTYASALSALSSHPPPCHRLNRPQSAPESSIHDTSW